MDNDRNALRAKLREKIQSKRSTRSGNADPPSRAKVEEVALSLAGSDAQTLGTVLDVIKNPAHARGILSTRNALNTTEDDDEAPPPDP